MKIINMLNFNDEVYPGQVFTQPSMTVPDMTMSVREIFMKHAGGMSPAVAFGVHYELDEDADDDDGVYMPDPRSLDIVERKELEASAKAQIRALAEKQTQKPNSPTKAPVGPTAPSEDKPPVAQDDPEGSS